MGSGPVARIAAATVTMGLSEAGQKKPFQDMGNDNPTGPMSGGPLRFAGGLLAPTMDAMMPKPPDLSNPTAGGKNLPEAIAPINDLAKKRSRRNFSTVLTDPISLGSSTANIGKASLLGSGLTKSFLGR